MMAYSKQQVATVQEVRRQASRYIFGKFGDRLWAGEPAYDECRERWTVPIHSRSLPADITLGHITLDSQGIVVRAPSRRALQRAIEPHLPSAPAPNPQIVARNRLVAALHRLAFLRQDLSEQLTSWRKQVERGVVHAEATLRAVLTARRTGTVEVLRSMSHPSLQFQYAGMSIKGERGETVGEGQAVNAVVITTHAVPGAKVAVEGDAVMVTFLDWQVPSPPLVVLVPDDERSEPLITDLAEGEGGAWRARFERVPAGAYLLAIAPVSDTLSS